MAGNVIQIWVERRIKCSPMLGEAIEDELLCGLPVCWLKRPYLNLQLFSHSPNIIIVKIFFFPIN